MRVQNEGGVVSGRVGGGLLVLGSVALVGLMALSKSAPTSAELAIDSATPRRVSLPAALRPPAVLRIDLGTAEARTLLSTGFGPDQVAEGRSVVKTSAGRALLTATLAPDPVAMTLTLLAKTDRDIAPHAVTVRVNDAEAGVLSVLADWAILKLEISEKLLVSGRNHIEFVSSVASGGVLLDQIRFDGVSSKADLNFGSAETRPLLSKNWGPDETLAGRTAARLRPGTSEVSFPMRPVADDYALGVVLMSEVEPRALSLTLDDQTLGTFTPAKAYGSHFLRVSRARLHAGQNTLRFLVSPGAHYAVDYVTIRPIESDAFLDVGAPEARANLAVGFSVDEPFEAGTAAWSDGASSRVVLWLRPLAALYRVSLRASSLGPLAPLAVEARLNGKALGSLTIDARFATHSLPIPVGQLRDGENVLEFVYAGTKRPSSFVAGSADTRDLAVRFDWLEIVRQP